MAFTGQLVERLTAARELLVDAPRGTTFQVDTLAGRLSGFGLEAKVSATRPPVPEPTEDLALERALVDACTAAARLETGLVLTIDELQLARRADLAGFAATLQQHVPDGWPLVMAAAGLPSIRDSDRSVTYLERGEWHELGLLDLDQTLAALRGPAQDAGRPLEDGAAMALARACGGYPYAIQVFGHHAWRASTGAPTVTAAHVADSLPRAERDLTAGLYAGRWEDAAPKERLYLLAVADLTVAGEEPTGAAVAARLGSTTRQVSYLRDRLLKKGTLVALGGSLRFPVPGMARWVTERG